MQWKIDTDSMHDNDTENDGKKKHGYSTNGNSNFYSLYILT